MSVYIKRLMAFIVLMTAGVVCLNAQSRAYYVNFNYDNDGNRISRFISLGDDRDDRSSSDTTETIHYTDIIDESQINIYPNPTTESVFVNITNPEDGNTISATMLSPTGVLLDSKVIGAAAVEFDLSGKAAGIYILELRSENDTKTWKIIKR